MNLGRRTGYIFDESSGKNIYFSKAGAIAYLRKNIIQKRYNLGTIVLSTPAAGYVSGSRARSGIKIADIPNPDENYAKIKRMINQAS